MIPSKFTKEEYLRVLIDAAKQSNKLLTPEEQQFDSSLKSLSQSRYNEVKEDLRPTGCLEFDLIIPKSQPNSGGVIMPYSSSNFIGITDKGQDLINDLIKSMEIPSSKLQSSNMRLMIYLVVFAFAVALVAILIKYVF